MDRLPAAAGRGPGGGGTAGRRTWARRPQQLRRAASHAGSAGIETLFVELHGHGQKYFQQREPCSAGWGSAVAPVWEVQCAGRRVLFIALVESEHRSSNVVQLLSGWRSAPMRYLQEAWIRPRPSPVISSRRLHPRSLSQRFPPWSCKSFGWPRRARSAGLPARNSASCSRRSGKRSTMASPPALIPIAAQRVTFFRSLHLSELALAHACAWGRDAAWERFLSVYRASLTQAAIAITGSDTIGRELADSLYAELYGLRERDGQRRSPLASYSGRGSLLGWLRTTLAQRHIDYHRRTRREAPLEDVDPPALESPVSPGSAELARISDAVSRSLQALAAEDRFVLCCYFLDRQSLLAISRILRVHEATVSRRLKRLVADLRKRLVHNLQSGGLSKRAAEEALGADPRDIELNLRALLQTSQTRSFSGKDGRSIRQDMSELLQSGQHPDADQLSAFLEHALPAQEQEQTLAHLAVCPHCRSVVALSMPPAEESPKPHAEPVRRPWLSGWNLVWPAAAALAAVVLVGIYIRRAPCSPARRHLPRRRRLRPPEAALKQLTPPVQTPQAGAAGQPALLTAADCCSSHRRPGHPAVRGGAAPSQSSTTASVAGEPIQTERAVSQR